MIVTGTDGSVESMSRADWQRRTPLAGHYRFELDQIRERQADDALMAGILEQLLEGSVTERPEWQALERTITRYSVGVKSESHTIGYSMLRRLVDIPAWAEISEAQLLDDETVSPDPLFLEVGAFRVTVQMTVDWRQVVHAPTMRTPFRDLSDAVRIDRVSKRHGEGGIYYVAPLGMSDAEAHAYGVFRGDGLGIEEATVAAVSLA